MSLTAEQHRHAESWVAGRWRYCPYCNNRKPRWAVSGPLEVPPPGVARQAGQALTGLPVIAVTCSGCAATAFLEANRLGMPS
jgi:hypothetical protein